MTPLPRLQSLGQSAEAFSPALRSPITLSGSWLAPYRHAAEGGFFAGQDRARRRRDVQPIQQRLDTLDLLNQWTTPIGSAVFAIPPGCAEGEFLGESVLR